MFELLLNLIASQKIAESFRENPVLSKERSKILDPELASDFLGPLFAN